MKLYEAALARAEPRPVRRHDVTISRKLRIDHSARRSDERTCSPAGGSTAAERASAIAIDDLPVPHEARLKALFDLTTAEVRLAQLLSRGDSVDEAARTLCVKISTARTQLAAIFAKTDTRRQAKLVAVLSRIAHIG
jgi:DNA-binding CsgD family transcriptional regulator